MWTTDCLFASCSLLVLAKQIETSVWYATIPFEIQSLIQFLFAAISLQSLVLATKKW